jgi:hypothetical protein
VNLAEFNCERGRFLSVALADSDTRQPLKTPHDNCQQWKGSISGWHLPSIWQEHQEEDVAPPYSAQRRLVTEEQKRILKNIGKAVAYTAITGGAYFLARGALSLLLKKMESKDEAPKVPHRKAQSG